MAKKVTEDEQILDFTDEDLFIAAVDVRVRGLEGLLSREFEGASFDEMLGVNGLPFLRIGYEEEEIDVSYYPVGDVDDDAFILMLRSVVIVGKEEDPGFLLTCESFNFGSAFGFAVYDPVTGNLELRAQIPESGGLSDISIYKYYLDLFMYSMEELKESLAES